MWLLYDLEGIYSKTDSATKNSLFFPTLSTTKLTTVYDFMFKILRLLKMADTLVYMLNSTGFSFWGLQSSITLSVVFWDLIIFCCCNQIP